MQFVMVVHSIVLRSDNAHVVWILSACFLGFRPLAMFNIRKSDYDAETHTITGGVKTDAGRNRIVPVSPIIQPFIDKLMKSDSEYLFPNRHGDQMTVSNYRNECFFPALKLSGYKKSRSRTGSLRSTPRTAADTRSSS